MYKEGRKKSAYNSFSSTFKVPSIAGGIKHAAEIFCLKLSP